MFTRLPNWAQNLGATRGEKKVAGSGVSFSSPHLSFWLGRSNDAPGSLPSTLIPLRSLTPDAHSRPPWDFQAQTEAAAGGFRQHAQHRWLNDAAAPGQRMLAQMGWSAGQSLGLTMPGSPKTSRSRTRWTTRASGAQRHEREARANGKDIWVGGGGDLGSLFERLNAPTLPPLRPRQLHLLRRARSRAMSTRGPRRARRTRK